MRFIVFFCLFLFIVNVTFGEEMICEPEARWKSQCNSCWCNKDGTASACTKIGCPPNGVLVDVTRSMPAKVCEPKKTWKEKCNDCWCNDEGTAAACTRKGCEPEPAKA